MERKAWLTIGLVAVLACVHGVARASEEGPSTAERKQFARPTAPPASAKDDTPAMVDLGKTLFFDPRLSVSRTQSCVSCHHPGMGWEIGVSHAIGHGAQEMPRKAQTLYNMAWNDSYFWDGRASSLEAQALTAMAGAKAMNLPPEELEKRVREIKGYAPLFARAFPGKSVDRQGVARALGAYERTIVSGESAFDRWLGGDAKAMSASAVRGFRLFTGKANCVACHSGWNFSDQGFHDIGLGTSDIGRGKQMPAIESMKFAFKTPTLRGISTRAPYMHEGQIRTLAEVIDFYDRGGDAGRPGQSPDVRKLGLSSGEKESLVEFLRALEGHDAPVTIPTMPTN